MMLDLIPRLPLYTLFRFLHFPKVLPFSLGISLTNKCNLRCKTCRIYEAQGNELSLPELTRTFKSIGRRLFWVTLAGGEPFLRDDIDQILFSLSSNCNPRIVSIATNGFFTKIILDKVKKMSEASPRTKLVVNVSIDDIGERHDNLRSQAGSYQKAVETFKGLKSLNIANLSVGICTTISKFNAQRIPEIFNELIKLNPDSYIFEFADKRKELNTTNLDLLPANETISADLDFISDKMDIKMDKAIPRIVQAIRRRYYQLSKKVLLGKVTIPCYAGIACAHISTDGYLWSCPTKARVLGNIRQAGFDFKKIWLSKDADKVRQDIKNERCFCLCSHVNYINLLCDLKNLLKIGFDLLR